MKSMMVKPSFILAAMLALGTVLQVNAQVDSASHSESSIENGFNDEEFIATNLQHNHKEVELAQLAIEKSQNENVKAVAEILVKNHSKMVQDLGRIQGTDPGNQNEESDADNNVNSTDVDSVRSLPGDTGTASNQLDIVGNKTSRDIDSAGKANAMAAQTGGATHALAVLAEANGETFDSLWIRQMLIDQKISLGKLHQAKKAVQDPQLKTIVQNAIPEVRNHRDMLAALQENPDEPVQIRGKNTDAKKMQAGKKNRQG